VTPRVIGLDLSLTATGFAAPEYVEVVKTTTRGMLRLAALRMAIVNASADASIVVIEGYSMGTMRQPSQAHGIGELGGVVKLGLWEAEIPYVDVAPASLKKFATDRGNATKLAMGLAAQRAGYDGPEDDNAIDAWWLRQMGLYAFDVPKVPVTAYRTEAMAKVAWPAVPVVPVSLDFDAPPAITDTAAL
jgi:Holliday junction resolvasome RuvABC endonuclease subunit